MTERGRVWEGALFENLKSECKKKKISFENFGGGGGATAPCPPLRTALMINHAPKNFADCDWSEEFSRPKISLHGAKK